MKRLLMVSLGSLLGVSCATIEVDKTIALRESEVGQSFAEEVIAQSPDKTVTMSWLEARENMKVRNGDFMKALETKADSSVKSPFVADLVTHLQDSVNDTVTGALSPRAALSVMKSPVEELPKHFENVASVKDLSHNLQLKALENARVESTSTETLRKLEVELYSLFKKHQLLQTRIGLLKKGVGQAEIGEKLESAMKQELAGREAEYEKSLNAVRDFFNAEYGNVKFVGKDSRFVNYRGVKNPQFNDWQRWRVLQRESKLASQLKEKHEKSKPVVPGTKFVQNKLQLMMHLKTEEESIENSITVRNNVRSVLKNWRLLKEVQADLADTNLELESAKQKAKAETKVKAVDADLLTELELGKRLFSLEAKEIDLAKNIWLIDEKCWPE